MRVLAWDSPVKESYSHLVLREVVCCPQNSSGLGFDNIHLNNKALLGKWRCHFNIERGSCRREVVNM